MSESRPVLLLTGASRGIGLATAELFHQRGWEVLTISRGVPPGGREFHAGGEGHIPADLGNLEGIAAVAEKVRARLAGGRLDALVNNAGISPKGPGNARLGVVETDASVWLRVLSTNLVSAALLCRALMAELLAARGTIVNVGSIAGSRVHPFAGVAYAASKAGLAALTRELAHEFGGAGRARQCRGARRDRDLDPFPGHGRAGRAAGSAEAAGPAVRGGGGDLFSGEPPVRLRQWGGNSGRWGPAHLRPGSPGLSGSERARKRGRCPRHGPGSAFCSPSPASR